MRKFWKKKKKKLKIYVEIFASVKGKSEFKTKVICTETKSPVDEKIDRN